MVTFHCRNHFQRYWIHLAPRFSAVHQRRRPPCAYSSPPSESRITWIDFFFLRGEFFHCNHLNLCKSQPNNHEDGRTDGVGGLCRALGSDEAPVRQRRHLSVVGDVSPVQPQQSSKKTLTEPPSLLKHFLSRPTTTRAIKKNLLQPLPSLADTSAASRSAGRIPAKSGLILLFTPIDCRCRRVKNVPPPVCLTLSSLLSARLQCDGSRQALIAN